MVQRNQKIQEIKQKMNNVEDHVYAGFCARIGVANIRQYEERELVLQQERAKIKADFDQQIDRIASRLDFEKTKDTQGMCCVLCAYDFIPNEFYYRVLANTLPVVKNDDLKESIIRTPWILFMEPFSFHNPIIPTNSSYTMPKIVLILQLTYNGGNGPFKMKKTFCNVANKPKVNIKLKLNLTNWKSSSWNKRKTKRKKLLIKWKKIRLRYVLQKLLSQFQN